MIGLPLSDLLDLDDDDLAEAYGEAVELLARISRCKPRTARIAAQRARDFADVIELCERIETVIDVREACEIGAER